MAVLSLIGILFLYGFWLVAKPYILKSSLNALPGPPRKSLITGNLSQIYNTNGWDFHRGIVEKWGRAVKVYGWFGAEQVYISDPKALHHIVVKDQHIYEETSWFLTSNRLIFGSSLVSSLGEQHKRQRKMLNPVFSINHMRNLTPIFYPITHKLRDAIAAQITDGPVKIDMLHWVARAALELIGQGGLGYSFDPLDPKEDTRNPYAKAIKDFAPTGTRLSLLRQSLPFIVKLAPPLVLRTIADHTPWESLQKFLKITDVMNETSLEVFANKKAALEKGDKALEEQVGQGKDMMSILMRANMAPSEKDRLPEDELLGQMNTFIFAGSDTASSAVARVLHTLACHPEAQSRLRKEVTEARRLKGDLDYDELFNLPYLDAVCRETLRLYAPITHFARTALKDIILPLGSPVKAKDGKTEINEIFIKEGTHLILGLAAANRSYEIWGPDAHEWKPERWLSPLPSSVTDARLPGVYANMMTFLGGGRACIGFKFAQLELKIILSVLLETLVLEPAEEEIVWLMSTVATPSVKGEEHMIPHLPMKVSFAKDIKDVEA